MEDTERAEELATVIIDLYQKKYVTLRQRCETLQQNNEKLVNRLHHVKKMIRKFKKDRRMLLNKLDEHGDNYEEALVPYMWEESQVYGLGELGTEEAATVAASNALSVDIPVAAETFSSPGSKPKKAKVEKEKDPHAPKKPANAFFMFCQQQRAIVQEEYFKEHQEEMSHQDLTKHLATEWNNLAQEKKKVYFDMYEREKERYEEEMKIYTTREAAAAAAAMGDLPGLIGINPQHEGPTLTHGSAMDLKNEATSTGT